MMAAVPLTLSFFLYFPGTYQYTNTTFQHNLEKPKSHPNEYSNDVLTEKSLAWIDKAAQHENKAPFFLAINPITPHSNLDWHKGWAPPVPAKRHEDAFRGVKVPRNVSFNPDKVINLFSPIRLLDSIQLT